MTDVEFEDWKTLQLVGLDLVERIDPVCASHVRLGVALGQTIQAGNAAPADYDYFEAWHYAGKYESLKAIPCGMR
jgi:hypothetical protein